MRPIVKVAHGSVTEGTETVLVNASNTNAALGSGVSGAIRAACGPGYQEHIVGELHARFAGPMSPGQVLVTDAGQHPSARWVAHVAVMDYRDGFTGGSYPNAAVIQQACEQLWPAIDALGPECTVAMVALGAGTGKLGVQEPTRIACETLRAHLAAVTQTSIAAVTFYGFQLHEYLAIAEVVLTAFPEAAVDDEARAYLAKLHAPA